MSVVDIKAPPEFDTLEVLAAAVAIYEYQGGYFKSSEFISDSDDLQVKRFANREILRSQFMVDYYSGTDKPPLVKVYDRHREEAERIREYTKKEIFNVLANQESYNTNLYEILNRPYVTATNFGFVASAPFYFKYSKEKDFYKEKINNIQSQHVAAIDSKVYLNDFEVIRNNKSNNFPGYIIQGICEGNLYLFFTRYDSWADKKPGSIVHIEGKVKDHVLEQGTIPMTKLNRVYERVQTQNELRTISNSNMLRQRKVTDSGGDSLQAYIELNCKSEPFDSDGNDLQPTQ